MCRVSATLDGGRDRHKTGEARRDWTDMPLVLTRVEGRATKPRTFIQSSADTQDVCVDDDHGDDVM